VQHSFIASNKPAFVELATQYTPIPEKRRTCVTPYVDEWTSCAGPPCTAQAPNPNAMAKKENFVFGKVAERELKN
jgi:hypothetical protein